MTRSGVAPICTEVPRSLREWKTEFFYISSRIIPRKMKFFKGNQVPDYRIPGGETEEWFARISASPSPLRHFLENSLVLLGMSRIWNSDGRVPVVRVNDAGKCVCFGFLLDLF